MHETIRDRWEKVWRAARRLRQVDAHPTPPRGDLTTYCAAVLIDDPKLGIAALSLVDTRDYLASPAVARGVRGRLLAAALHRRHGSPIWHALLLHFRRLPLVDLTRPRCRVCRWPCSDGGCQPDLCSDVTRPGVPRG